MKSPAPLLAVLITAVVAARADTPLRGSIDRTGVSGGAIVRGNLLLTRAGGNGLALLPDGIARLRSGAVRVAPGEGLEPALKDTVDLHDLEDAAWDGAHDLFVITSHGRTRLGDGPENRYRLARLRFDATGRLLEARQSDALLRAIVNHVPFLADSIRRTPARTGLNIEGLAWDPKGELVIGLRSPTVTESTPRPSGGQEDAVILRLKNPNEVFEQAGQDARLGDVVKLDLHGQGIRGMAYDPRLKAFWIASGLSAAPNHPVKSPWALWLWNGDGTPREVPVPAGTGVEQPGAVLPLDFDGKPHLLLIDGGSPASPYALIPTPEIPR